jgi:hypothetical protein
LRHHPGADAHRETAMQDTVPPESGEARRERTPAPESIAKAPLSPFRLPSDTTPTWEVELLLSGGTLFALLQLPGWLTGLFDQWAMRVGEGALYVMSFGLVYGKVIIFAMITTLIAHLLTRGLWVAAIGLRSVYPGGIRWRKLRHGARYRALARAHVPTLKRIIDRSDDFASQMFAVAALLVVMALYSLVGSAFVFGAAWAISGLLLGGRYVTEVLLALVALLTLSQIAGVLIDRRANERGRARRKPLRWLLAMFRFQLMFPFARLSQSLMLVFTSHFGSIKGTVALVLLMYALIAMAISDLVFERESTRFGPAGAMHEVSGNQVVSTAHYADQRGDASREGLTPYIDSARPRGDYLELVIPFHPRRHPQALEQACPGALEAVGRATKALQRARSLGSDEADSDGVELRQSELQANIEAAAASREQSLASLLECATGLHAPAIDGVAASDVQLQWMTSADQSQPAFAAYLPLHDLSRGRHVLEVQTLPEPDSEIPFGRSKGRPKGPSLQIPFWR